MTRDLAASDWMTAGDAEILSILGKDLSDEERRRLGAAMAGNDEEAKRRPVQRRAGKSTRPGSDA